MSSSAIALLVIGALFALIVVGLWATFAEKRKARGSGKNEGGQAASLVRAGLMEAQNLLEPERKIEVVREAERKRDLLVDVREDGEKLP